jgi:SAM-dependent methyltransferase
VLKTTFRSFVGTLLPVAINKLISPFFSLSIRKKFAVNMDKMRWFPFHHTLSMAVIRDWAEKDANEFHRFLWSNHLGYAGYYEAKHSFGSQNLVLTRRMLFEDLMTFLSMKSKSQQMPLKINSIFEVGCSSGYMLRYFETDLFPEATALEGLDIDKIAIDTGRKYLKERHSKIRLINSDISNLDTVIGNRKFDLILCAGVLLYLPEEAAKSVVSSMLRHCSKILAIKELAHPDVDNSKLEHSEFRSTDKTFIHNIDKMVKESGGRVLFRRWEGSKMYEGQTVYFVFCNQ